MIAAVLLAATTMVAPTTAETDPMFAAAGAVRRGRGWTLCTKDPRATMRIDLMRDINRDGLTDVIVVEDSAICYGNEGKSFALLAGQPGGKWRKLLGANGVAEVQDGRGAGTWPDILISGRGACFPVLRWNGRAYVNHRREHFGKPCR
jgi:hypothetical protein